MEKSEKKLLLWKQKIDRSIAYLSELEKKSSGHTEEVQKEIVLLEQKLAELEHVFKTMNKKKDPNIALFSPYVDEEDQDCLDQIKRQMNEICNKLPELQEELKILKTEKEEHENLENCLLELDKIKDEKINLKGKDKEEREGKDKEEPISKLKIEKIDTSDKKILNDTKQKRNILEVQEEERKRIARDLHDSTVQNLTNLVHKIELCMRLLDLDIIRAKLELVTTSDAIRSIINDMRSIIYDLRPMSLQDLGLVATIEQMSVKLREQSKLQIILKVNKDEQIVLPIINLTLYRIVQEACTNALKHSEASTIKIYINYNLEDIELIITDDGKGFNVEEKINNLSQNGNFFGLSILKERTYLLSGEITIQSLINRGTEIRVKVPYGLDKGDEI